MEVEKVKEIKKALESCSVRSGKCDQCPFIKGFDCDLYLLMDALKLINELESENKHLESENFRLVGEVDRLTNEGWDILDEKEDKIRKRSSLAAIDAFLTYANDALFDETKIGRPIDRYWVANKLDDISKILIKTLGD